MSPPWPPTPTASPSPSPPLPVSGTHESVERQGIGGKLTYREVLVPWHDREHGRSRGEILIGLENVAER
ncbi:hypothetical protein BS47DRAFT_1345156, partial [Hydnum rufescens UP504]